MFLQGWAKHIPTDFIKAYPTLEQWMERMYAIPQIRKWYKMDLDLSIKVTYFNIAGAAEKVRLALVMCGKEFQDERINFQVFEMHDARAIYCIFSI